MIYMLLDEGRGVVKIGMARSVLRRLSQIQTYYPYKLSLVRTLKGDAIAERWLHDHFCQRRINGEWFAWSEDMRTIEVPSFATVELPPNPLQAVYEIWPSVAQMAQELGEKRDTVQRWRSRGSIPAKYWGVLMDAAASRGTEITADMLLNLHSTVGA